MTEEKVTFDLFSSRLRDSFTNPDFFDIDYVNTLYEAYRDGKKGYEWELDEWIEFMFL